MHAICVSCDIWCHMCVICVVLCYLHTHIHIYTYTRIHTSAHTYAYIRHKIHFKTMYSLLTIKFKQKIISLIKKQMQRSTDVSMHK